MGRNVEKDATILLQAAYEITSDAIAGAPRRTSRSVLLDCAEKAGIQIDDMDRAYDSLIGQGFLSEITDDLFELTSAGVAEVERLLRKS